MPTRKRSKPTQVETPESLSLLRATLEATADGILVVDNDAGTITAYNQKFADMWRIPPEVMATRQCDVAIRYALDQLQDPDGFLKKLETLRARPEQESADTIEFKDGRAFEHSSRPLFADGVCVGRVWSFHDIGRSRRVEDRLRQSEERFRHMLELSSDWYWEQDEQCRFTQVARRSHSQFGPALELGKTRWEIPGVGQNSEEVWREHRTVVERREPYADFVFTRVNTHGELRYLSVNGEPVFDREGTFKGYRGTGRDVTEQVLAQQALQDSEERYRTLFDSHPIPMWVLDSNSLAFLAVNEAAVRHYGYGKEEFLAMSAERLNLPEDIPRLRQVIEDRNLAATRRIWRHRKKSDELIDVEIVSFNLEFDGRQARLVVATDITERVKIETQARENEQRLANLAQYDTLTCLPNRNLFQDRLQQAMAWARRNKRMMALMFLDLDHFKGINDTLGHEAGDRLLKAVASRLKDCLREPDTIARLGGDEFTVILEDIDHVDRINAVAQKILDTFVQPFHLGTQEVFTSTSIGIATFQVDDDLDSLLKHADIAMYRAKEEGRNTFLFYDAGMSAETKERVTLEASLRQAMERGEFRLHYQPIIDLRSGVITGVEALLRWQHPQWGLVAPDRFIKQAEQTGLIVPIGEWVLRTACAQCATWQRSGLPALRIAVNLSARQFRRPNLVDVVAGILNKTGLDPRLLELEITEGLLLENPQSSNKVLERLKKLGITISVDDFGTGHSLLHYLKHFPLDVLKIDPSFVRAIGIDADNAAVVEAVGVLARSLGLKLTAEGVESQAQLTFLHKRVCDTAQGYFFSRPVPAEAIDEMRLVGGKFTVH